MIPRAAGDGLPWGASLPPAHGGQLRQIAAQHGIPEHTLLDFSANINPAGPPPAVLPALVAALQTPETLTRYPDLELPQLKQTVATYAGTSAENIAIANGFVPLLEATLRTLHLRHTLLPVPCFVEYRPALTRAGIRTTPRPTLHYGPELLEGPHDSILLANPQNPTGLATPPEDLLALIRSTGKTILLDEAFIDYLPDSSLVPHLTPNLVVFRSVTKFHAIPGLRVAYLASVHAADIAANLPPWPIGNLAALAVEAALPDATYAAETRTLNHYRRERLHRALTQLGLDPYAPAANFLLFRLPPSLDPTAFHDTLVRDHGIVLRPCTNYEALTPNHFRTAIRTEPDNQRLIQALTQSLHNSGCSILTDCPTVD